MYTQRHTHTNREFICEIVVSDKQEEIKRRKATTTTE